jgi:hypothetical protein
MYTEEQRVIDELYNRETRSDFTYPDTSIKTPVNTEKYPDAKKHQIISFIKSGIRIVATIIGVAGFYELGFFGLLVAEVVGIYEELV